MLSPILDELAKDYKDKVDFYKINTEEQMEMAQLFGIMSVPTLVMMSKKTKPVSIPGVARKESLSVMIDEFLEKDKNDN